MDAKQAEMLDRPIWHALTGLQSSLAEGGLLARAFASDIGPLAAASDNGLEAQTALASLVRLRGSLTLLQVSTPALPTGCLVEMDAEGVQMVCLGESASRHAGDIVPLGDSDAPDMMELAQLTAPGPFAARTHRLGQFYGIRREGRLVAMTGERMRLPGFAEVSGVCTHPDWRGHGFAEQLCQRVIAAIRTRGETPFLHAIASNVSAVSLYEKLGFSIRTRLHVVKLMPDPASR